MKILKKSSNPNVGFNISQSALGRFQDCRQKARYALEGWVPKQPSRPLVFGNFFHNCLASVNAFIQKHKTAPSKGEIEELCNVEWEHFLQTPEAQHAETANQMQYDAQVILILLINYVEQYFDKDVLKNWINIEGRIDTAYAGNRLMGYLDGAYMLNEDKEVWVFETKTKSYEDLESLGRILHMDFQTFYYMHLFKRKTGRLPNGICYNIIFKPTIRKGKKESMTEFLQRLDKDVHQNRSRYFVRLNVSIDPSEYIKWRETTLKPLLKDYSRWATGKAPTYRNTAMCNGKYGKCPYLEICSLNSYALVKKQDWGGRR